jgi:hypothetical protein
MPPERGAKLPLGDAGELLHRQVHPSWIQAGRPTSQAWRPTPKDEGLLSVSRASQRAAADSYRHHTKVLGRLSAGVWGVTVEECTGVGLSAFADPIDEPIPDPAHAVIDFRGLSDKDCRIRGAQLQNLANKRGCIYAEREAGSPPR